MTQKRFTHALEWPNLADEERGKEVALQAARAALDASTTTPFTVVSVTQERLPALVPADAVEWDYTIVTTITIEDFPRSAA